MHPPSLSHRFPIGCLFRSEKSLARCVRGRSILSKKHTNSSKLKQTQANERERERERRVRVNGRSLSSFLARVEFGYCLSDCLFVVAGKRGQALRTSSFSTTPPTKVPARIAFPRFATKQSLARWCRLLVLRRKRRRREREEEGREEAALSFSLFASLTIYYRVTHIREYPFRRRFPSIEPLRHAFRP